MITRDDWLKALSEADIEVDTTALTFEEIRMMWGLKRTTAQRRLQNLIAQNKVVVTQKYITRMDGYKMLVAAYRLVDNGKEPSH